MKKFKTNIKKVNDDIVEKKFEEDLKEIKDKLYAEKLSDEFLEKLNKTVENYNKDTGKTKSRTVLFNEINKKIVGICACFVLIFSSYITFADYIENIAFELFKGTDNEIENVIEKGNYKKINMEYVENNEISIKVDYVATEKNNLYIAFNILTKNKYDKLYLDDIIIKDKNNFVIMNKQNNKNNSIVKFQERKISDNNSIIINEIEEMDDILLNENEIMIEINGIKLLNGDDMIYEKGLWKFEINI